MANDHQRRSRRIHVEGAADDWRLNRPVRDLAPSSKPAEPPTGYAGSTSDRLDEAAAAARLEEAIATARRQTAEVVVHFAALEEGLQAQKGTDLAEMAAAVDVARRQAAADRLDRLARLEEDGAGRSTTLDEGLERAVRELGTGPAGGRPSSTTTRARSRLATCGSAP